MFPLKNNLFLLVGLSLVFCLATLVQGQKNSPKTNRKECNRKKVDACSSRLVMLGDKTFVYPETIEQMNIRCKELKPLEKCLKDFTTKCLPSVSSSSMSVIAYSISRTNKGYCSSKKRKLAFSSFGSCVNANKKVLDGLADNMTKDFYAITEYKDQKLRIPLVCCSYHSFKRNVMNVVNAKCQKHFNEIEFLIDGYAHDVLNLVCGDYNEESDKCNTIAHKMPTLKGSVKTNSFLLPLAEIFESLT